MSTLLSEKRKDGYFNDPTLNIVLFSFAALAFGSLIYYNIDFGPTNRWDNTTLKIGEISQDVEKGIWLPAYQLGFSGQVNRDNSTYYLIDTTTTQSHTFSRSKETHTLWLLDGDTFHYANWDFKLTAIDRQTVFLEVI